MKRQQREWAKSGLLCVCVAMALPSCGGGDTTTPTPTVSSVAVSGTAVNTVPGQTLQLTAIATLSNGSTQNVTNSATWTTSSTTIANVSTTGLVTGGAVGDATIGARHQNVLGTLLVGIKSLIARFTVSNATGPDVCRIVAGSGGNLDCTFNGSTSLGNPTTWAWSFVVATATGTSGNQSTATFVPTPGCGFFATKAAQIGTTGSVQMIVRLTVSKTGGVSEEVTNQNVRLFPQSQCGYGF